MNVALRLSTVLLLCLIGLVSKGQKSFITTWKTDNPGMSNDSSITISTNPGYSMDYNYEVDWDNDGKFDESNITGDITHTFKEPGTYQIAIRGIFPAIYFNNGGDKSKLISLNQWGDLVWKTFLHAFHGCDSLMYEASDEPLIDATSMTSMFEGCVKFNGDIGKWDVSNITHMNHMFSGAVNFNQDIGSWDVSSLRFMSYMFSDAEDFDQDIGSWDVSQVENMQYVFLRAESFNQDIGAWDMGNVVFTVGMFASAIHFNQDIGSWDVSSVQNMSAMFSEASSFDQDIGSWDISNVQSLANAFDLSGIRSDNYDNILIGWAFLNNLQNDVALGASGIEYCYGEHSRNILEFRGWTITGDTMDCSNSCNPGPVNITFTGMAGSLWLPVVNWNLGFVPTPCFHVYIPTNENAVIDDTLNAEIFSIEVANGASFEVENGGQLECLIGN